MAAQVPWTLISPGPGLCLGNPTCGGGIGDGHRAINDRPAVFSAK
jgi:hypothetical protein